MKFAQLDRAITSAQRTDPFAPVTVIVPSPYARVQLRRELGLRRSLCNVALATWGEVVADLARLEAGSPVRVPGRAVLDEALRQVLRDGPAELAAVGASAPGRADLAEICTELWRADPSVRVALGAHGSRSRALVEVVARLETRLAAVGFTDPGRLLDLAAAGTRHSTTTFVSWFLRPTEGREAAVLDGLVSRQLLAGAVGIDPGEPTSLEVVVRCPDPDAEVRTVLRRVLAAAEAGVELWRQAIVHPPNPRYRRIVHQQLAAAGVPVAGRASLTLAHSTAGRLLTGALELPADDWRRETLVGWLDAAGPLALGPDGAPVPVRLYDEVSARAGVVAGLAQWRSRLERFAHLGPAWDPYVAHTNEEAQAARALAGLVEQLADELGREHRRWSEWARWARDFLDRRLRAGPGVPGWPAHDRLAADAVRALLDELGQLDTVGGEADRTTFGHALAQELALRPMRADEPTAPALEPDPVLDPGVAGLGGPIGWGIFVGTPAEARGLTFDAVHLVGLDDEDLPGSDASGSLTLLPGAARDDWPGGTRAAELLGDLQVVVALADRTTGTWPSVDPRTGRELARSRWLDTGQAFAPTAEEVVPSFAADLVEQAGARPVNGAERRLHALVEAAGAGHPVEAHPAASGGNPPLAAALASARSAARGEFSRYEGNVGADRVRPIAGEIAPTSLEDYATCPRRYLLARELGIRPPYRPEANEALTASDRGILVHEILARYGRERVEQGAPASLDRLLEITRERFDLAQQEGRCGPAVVAQPERSILERELRRLFDEDRLEPVSVELAFGTAGVEGRADRVPAVEVEIGEGRTVRLGGRIDRVDRAPDGSLVVSDYKTGRQTQLGSLTADPVAQGTKLQLVIYGLAARALPGSERGIRSRYWLVSLGRSAPSLQCRLDDRVAARLREVVGLIVRGIEAGVFPAVPGKETYRRDGPTFEHCASCPFDRVCPVDRGRRWEAQLGQPELAPVLALAAEPSEELAGLVSKAPLWEPE